MSLRCTQPGWVKVHPDSTKRRGLWIRSSWPTGFTDMAGDVIELCAGREGDDAYVRLTYDDFKDSKIWEDLKTVLLKAEWAGEEYKEQDGSCLKFPKEDDGKEEV